MCCKTEFLVKCFKLCCVWLVSWIHYPDFLLSYCNAYSGTFLSASHCVFIKTCHFWNATPPCICGLGKLHILLSVWVTALWKCVLGLRGTAGLIAVKHLKQVLFLHDSLCRTGLLEPELWPWEFHNGWDDNVETWAVSKAIYSMWEELRRLWVVQVRRCSQVQLPAVHGEPWWSFISTLRLASGITAQLNCTGPGNTREQKNIWWKKFASVNYSPTCSLMV